VFCIFDKSAKEQKPMCELLEEMIEERKFNNECSGVSQNRLPAG